MAKRRPEKTLTQENYDEEDENEEMGTFQVAGKADLANRIIKKAKRRNLSADTPTSSPLTNFAGFSTAPANSPFSFFSKISQKAEDPSKTQESVNTDEKKKPSDVETLKSLNLCFMKWIQQHLENNPYVVLVPVFRDYEKHLSSLSLGSSAFPTLNTTANSSTVTTSSFAFSSTAAQPWTSAAPTVNFSSGSSSSSMVKPVTSAVSSTVTAGNTLSAVAFKSLPSSDFKLSAKDNDTNIPVFSTDTTSTSASSTFKFGSFTKSSLNNGNSAAADTVKSPVFSISGAPTLASDFSFGLAKPQAEVTAAHSEEDQSDEPPQFDFVPVGEEGSVFDIRCKIFMKKKQAFNSIGVGTLFLKTVSGGKTQLIVRADTTQGSVLLNLILTPDLPLQSTGKNNVLLVCIPTPDAKPPPVPILIRVKTSEERDKLLKEMERLRAS